MNNSGFFVCGVLVGVVIAAACGLDLFRNPGSGVPRSGVPGSGVPGPGVSPPGVETSRVATQPVVAPAADEPGDVANGMLPGPDAAALELAERLAELERELGTARLELRDPAVDGLALAARTAELERAREDLELEAGRRRQIESDLDLLRAETHRLLVEFFRRERREEHAVLVLRYFASSAPERDKGNLVQHLLDHNPHILQSLAPQNDSGVIASTGTLPASVDAGAGGPAPAIAPAEDE